MDNPPIENSKVAAVYDSFPADIRRSLMELRRLILAVGNRIDRIARIEETVKWGEPSYSAISGSPVRLGWKKKDPERYAIYFHCQTKLVSAFRELYPKTFCFEGNRAILFHKNDRIPKKELKHCIELALTYHRRKGRPFLGAEERKARNAAVEKTAPKRTTD